MPDPASQLKHYTASTGGFHTPEYLGMRMGPRPCVRTERARLAELDWDGIEVQPIGATIGAEIRGVSLADLDDATFEEIRRAWLAYKVVFFPGQDITARQQIEFAQRFGELEDHPFLQASDKHGEVVRFEKGEEYSGYENLWHSDVSWREEPALGAILRAVEVPAIGGDTLFCDMVAAYEGLEDSVKERIDGLYAVHDFSHSFGRALPADELAKKQAEFPAVRHPIVRTHPETGQKILYVNAIFVSHVDGIDADESAYLLDLLCRQATIPEYQCRYRWQAGTVGFWDNRATQHYAASDYWPERRVMERVAIVGDRPH
jgi:alpha-ketoglutarate-dependent taurine dioxygenase